MADASVDMNGPETVSGDAAGIYPYAEPGPADVSEGTLSQPAWQAGLAEWIRTNQTLAMVLGFSVGVFVGVMIRD